VITTIVLIKAEPKQIPQCATKLAGIDGVTEVYSVSGEWDLVAIVRVAEYAQIAQVITATVMLVTRTATSSGDIRASPRSGRHGTTAAFGSSLADQRPLLKSVKRMCPFHGMAFITNEAFGVNPFGSKGL